MDLRTSNKLFSNIIASKASGVFIIAPSNYNKADFISELSNMYKNVYWFDLLYDDFDYLVELLVTKIVKDKQLRNKLFQLTLNKDDSNAQKIVIKAIFDYISQIKGSKLIVFENLHLIQNDNKLSVIYYLIKHAPNNLKIILSSDEYYKFQPYLFDPNYPLIIDKYQLIECSALCSLEDYISDFSEREVAMLIYLSSIPVIDKQIVLEICDYGEGVLDVLARKGIYVSIRDDRHYVLNTDFIRYLNSIRCKYQDIIDKDFPEDIEEKYYEHLFRVGRYSVVIKHYCRTKNIDKLNFIIEEVLVNIYSMKKIIDSLYIYDFILEFDETKYPYYGLFIASLYLTKGKNIRALHLLETAIETIKKKNVSRQKYLKYAFYYIVALFRLGKNLKVNEEMEYIKSRYGLDHTQSNIMRILALDRDSSYDFKSIELDTIVTNKAYRNERWYIKLLENVAYRLFNSGNYRKSISVAKLIKSHTNYYLIPAELVAMYYIAGEIEEFEVLVNNSYKLLIDTNISEDLDIIYTCKGYLESFYSNREKANEYFDLAYKSMGEINSEAKYFLIAHRIMYKARNGELDYARELADVMLKYSRTDIYAHEVIMIGVMALINFLDKDYEQAYQNATKFLQNSHEKSILWLPCMGVVTSVLYRNGNFKDFEALGLNLVKVAVTFGMKMVVAEGVNDVFKTIIDYGKFKKIQIDYINEISELIEKRKRAKIYYSSLKIKFFGPTLISVNNEEIKWRTQKARNLFLYYIISGARGLDKNEIIEQFWPSLSLYNAMQNLRTTNNYIRKTLKKNAIEYKLESINNRYVLNIEQHSCDYDNWLNKMISYKKETNLAKKLALVDDLLELFTSQFCKDLNIDCFKSIRNKLQQDLIIVLLQIINILINAKKYLEAKKYLINLKKIDKSDIYKNLEKSIESISVVSIN